MLQIPCTLCGNSFSIGRLRTADESPEAELDTEAAYWPGLLEACSSTKTGCFYVLRRNGEVFEGGANAAIPDSYDISWFDWDERQGHPKPGQQFPIKRGLTKRIGRIEIELIDLEHTAGAGCQSRYGYSGHRVSAREMRGCQTVHGLLLKSADWVP